MKALRIGAIAEGHNDRQTVARLIRDALPTARLEQFSQPEDFLRAVSQSRFDCLLIDFRLSGRDGLSLIADLRRNPASRSTPAILLTTHLDPTLQTRAQRHGAAACLALSHLGRDHLRRAIDKALLRRVEAAPAQAQDAAATPPRDDDLDPLTGLPTHEAFERRVDALLEERTPFALFVLSLDSFQHINDRFGRAGGDAVLRQMGQRLQRDARDGESCYRLPAREFGVIRCGDHDRDTIAAAALRVRRHLSAPMTILRGANYAGRCNLGVAMVPQDGCTRPALLAAAMQAMQASADAGDGPHFASFGAWPDPESAADQAADIELTNFSR